MITRSNPVNGTVVNVVGNGNNVNAFPVPLNPPNPAANTLNINQASNNKRKRQNAGPEVHAQVPAQEQVEVDEALEPERVLAGNEADNSDSVEEEDARKSRQTRKQTLWMFVERVGQEAMCRCGCLKKDGADRLVYSAPTTGSVTQHMQAKHNDLYEEFQRCRNANGDWNRLIEDVEALNKATIGKISKRRRNSEKFYSSIVAKNLEKGSVAVLKLLMWAVSNRIPRISLDDVLLDSYHKEIGATPAPNRQKLQDEFLVQLDDLIVKEYTEELSTVKCVSLSADGYRDKVRRDWINVTFYWCALPKLASNDLPKKWVIKVLKPDIIYLPSSATSDSSQGK